MRIAKYFISTALPIIILTINSFGQVPDVKSGSGSKSLIRMTTMFSDNQDAPDYSVIYFDPKATDEFDGQLDALKLMNTDLAVPNVYVITPSNVKLSIKAVPYAADTLYTIPLGLKISKPGDIIFRLQSIVGLFSEMRITITDNFTGTVQDLLNNMEYKVPLAVGEYSDRFVLNITNADTVKPVVVTDTLAPVTDTTAVVTDTTASVTDTTEVQTDTLVVVTDTTVVETEIPGDDIELPEVVTEISDIDKPSDYFSVYYANDLLNAEINNLSGREGFLRLFSLSGQMLYMKKIYSEGHHEIIMHVRNGIYLASFSSGNLTATKKIMIINR